MKDRLLLYIDILGFSDLVANSPSRIDDLYEVIASLNAHKHDAFKCVIFSDTILVYNLEGGDTTQDVSYLLMFMCEFAKDLLHRLTKRGIFFRAVITIGSFHNYHLNNIPCFYGSALVKAYEAEKNIKAIGVFMDRHLVSCSDIFHTTPFNKDFHFVYITQALETIERNGPPLPGHYIDDAELNWNGGPELLHITDLLAGLKANLPEHVIDKYKNTLRIYRKRYPQILHLLEKSNGDIAVISPDADWFSVIQRHPEDYAYAIDSREEF